MLALILPMVNDGETAVEFACGSGYIGLVLAALRPQVRVVLMDQNPVSIQYTKSRAAAANLTNVECVVGDIRDFHVDRGYSLGFALHACGAASVRFGSCMLVLLRSLVVTDQHMNMHDRLSWDRRCILFLLLHYITTSYTNCFFQS
jgi:16S rRNA G527 N7-methylase RsmG